MTQLIPDPEIWGRLTEMERRIFDAVAEGLSTPEIAYRFGISKATVGVHVYRIFHKVGCSRTRTRLVAVVCGTRSPLADDQEGTGISG